MNEYFKVQLHNHTKYSKDSVLPFSLLLYLCKKKNIDYIAITDHNTIMGGVAFKRYCALKNAHVHVIVGEEIMTERGEIIGLYLSENVPPGLSVLETIRRIKAQNGVVYVPHPYDEKRKKSVLAEDSIVHYREQIDCIEGWNGRNYRVEYGAKQKQLAEKYKIQQVIGADAHTFLEIGKNVMLFPVKPDNAEQFLAGIRNAICCPQKTSNAVHVLTKIDRAIKLIINGDFDEFRKIIARKIVR